MYKDFEKLLNAMDYTVKDIADGYQVTDEFDGKTCIYPSESAILADKKEEFWNFFAADDFWVFCFNHRDDEEELPTYEDCSESLSWFELSKIALHRSLKCHSDLEILAVIEG